MNKINISTKSLTGAIIVVAILFGQFITPRATNTILANTPIGQLCENSNIVSAIDIFQTKSPKITNVNQDINKTFGAVLSPTSLGGELDVKQINEGLGSNSDIFLVPFGNNFSFSNGPSAKGKVILTWDGLDNSENINFTGLNGVNLSQNGRRDIINFVYSSDFANDKAVVLTFTIYTNATNASKLTVPLYGALHVNLTGSVKLSDFTTALGTGATMTNVGAIVLEIDATSRLGHDFDIGNLTLPCLTEVPTLVCVPLNQTANINQTVQFTATGGNNTFAWSAPTANQTTGTGSSFNTSYSQAGSKTVTVSSNGQTASCNAQINTPTTVCVPNTNALLNNSAIVDNGNNSFNVSLNYSFTGTNSMKLVYINPDTNLEVVLNSSITASGSQVFNNFQPNKNYLFKISDTSTCGGLMATLVVRKDVSTSVCVANTNTVFSASTPIKNGSTYFTTLSWVTTGNNQVKVTMSSTDNNSQTQITTGNNIGTFTVNNLTPGKAYVYYLYDALCNNLLSSTAVYPPTDIIVYVPPIPNLVCLPNNQNITINQTVNFFAQGGNGNYSWNAPSASQTFGNGQNFSTSYSYAGYNTVSVSSNGQTANCYVNVSGNVQIQGIVQGANINLSYQKKANNDTKNVNAVSAPASKEDYITYTLTVTNSGNAPANNFVITDDLSGVLTYADIVDNGGAVLNGNILNYPGTNVPPGGSVSKSFKVRVKFSLANNTNYTMVNTYGNTVQINISSPQVLGTFFVAPKTGAETNAFVFAGLLTIIFTIYKKRKFFTNLFTA